SSDLPPSFVLERAAAAHRAVVAAGVEPRLEVRTGHGLGDAGDEVVGPLRVLRLARGHLLPGGGAGAARAEVDQARAGRGGRAVEPAGLDGHLVGGQLGVGAGLLLAHRVLRGLEVDDAHALLAVVDEPLDPVDAPDEAGAADVGLEGALDLDLAGDAGEIGRAHV